MVQLIDKSAVVAEIDSKKKCAQTLGDNAINSSMQQFYDGMKQGCVDILSFIDTIETKEVDLEKELDKYTTDNFWALDGNNESPYLLEKDDMLKVAKYFYELGLKTQKGE